MGSIKTRDVLRAWRSTLSGRAPTLSIEITRECPLRCPGCYAYGDTHLGPDAPNLRQLSDYRGEELVRRVLQLVDEHQPLHISIVGGDPLVRYRELEQILPALQQRGIPVQVVTSAFRQIPLAWGELADLKVVVSIDGLQPEHDARRKPATYERILNSIAGHKERITIHSTITAQTAARPGYWQEFLDFWQARPEIRQIWFSLYTPQVGESAAEILTPAQRDALLDELEQYRPRYSKLDMPSAMLREFRRPPASPDDCIFAKTTRVFSADLKTVVTPCQFGGKPDCSRCGCIASMGMAAVGHVRVMPGVTAGGLFHLSHAIGQWLRPADEPDRPSALPILQAPSER